MFGYCMPVLYLVAFVSIVIQYFFDRYRIAYFYRKPPMFSIKLTLSVLSLMSLASTAGLCMLFWQYTNKQMFDNKIDPIEYDDEPRLSHHFISEIQWSKLSLAQQFLVITILVMIVFHTLQYTFEFYLMLNNPNQKLTLVEQNLPNYFKSLQK